MIHSPYPYYSELYQEVIIDEFIDSKSIKKNYQRIKVIGKFDFDNQIYLYSLNDSGKPGYDVITPFKTTKNENVLINRGSVSYTHLRAHET